VQPLSGVSGIVRNPIRSSGLAMLPVYIVSLGAALAAFAAIGSLTWPLGDDQGVFYWAARKVLDGGVPYKDAWDVKGPLTYYVYAFVLRVFGFHECSIRLFDLCALSGCCWILRTLIMRLNGCDSLGTHLGIVFLVLSYYGSYVGNPGQPDGWAGMLMVLVVALLVGPSAKSPWTPAAAGALIGLATLLKPIYPIYLLLLLPYLFNGPSPKVSRFQASLQCLAAFMAVVATGVGILLWLSGGAEDLIDVLRFIASSYSPKRHFVAEGFILFGTIFWLGLSVPFLLAPIAPRVMPRAGRGYHGWVLMTWLAVASLTVIAQGRYWPYHWIPVLFPLALVLGVSVRITQTRSEPLAFTNRWRPAIVSAVCLCALVPVATNALTLSSQWPRYAMGWTSREQYVRHLTEPWPYWALKRLSDYLASRAGSQDKVLVWGWDPLVNVLSNRTSPTRFAYSYPLIAEGPLKLKYRRIFLDEISKVPPLYIVVDTKSSWALVNKSGLDLLRGFPEFNSFLHERYRYLGRFDDFQLWLAIQPTHSALSNL
jgi:hypothetical protein